MNPFDNDETYEMILRRIAVCGLFIFVMQAIRWSFARAYVLQYDSVRTRMTLTSMFDAMPDAVVVLKESKTKKKAGE